ncbi:Alpha/Beta hydrolase protein [Schizophyllum fasciatum]
MTFCTAPVPFRLEVSKDKLQWINERVRTSNIIQDVPHKPEGEWGDGVPSGVIQDYVKFWKYRYDWRKEEARINDALPMFTIPIALDGRDIISVHFVHKRSETPGAVPLLFAHGWPGNFLEVRILILFFRMHIEHHFQVQSLLSLTDPYGLHIIAPSIPGFSFSSPPQSTPGISIHQIASTYHKLMQELGYSRYLVQGGDWGSLIVRSMSFQHPEACIGIHINTVVASSPSPLRQPFSFARYVVGLLQGTIGYDKMRLWETGQESGYAKIQGTKPQTISYALADSPIGMLAWILDKLHVLASPGYEWDKTLVITWATLYLLADSSWHSRLYKYNGFIDNMIPPTVAFGASIFPYDARYAPRWLAKAMVGRNLVFWREHETGGHFASVEVPDLFLVSSSVALVCGQ